jgi:hypothetical protein
MKTATPIVKNKSRPETRPTPGSPDRTRSGHAETAILAHQLYEQRGRHPGYDLEDWTRAERSLSEQPASTNGGKR